MSIHLKLEVVAETTADLEFQLRQFVNNLHDAVVARDPRAVQALQQTADKGEKALAEKATAEKKAAKGGNGSEEPAPKKAAAKAAKSAVLDSDEPELTKADIHKALTNYVKKFDEAAAVKLLEEYGNGAQRISALNPEHYRAVYDAAMSV